MRSLFRFNHVTLAIALVAVMALQVVATAIGTPGALAVASCIGDHLATLGTGVLLVGATLGTGQLTLMDYAKRVDPDGAVATVAELLSQQNDMLEDMVWMPGNLPTGHRVTIRTGLPSVYWRSVNAGTPSSKSRTAQVDEGVGELTAYSTTDCSVAELGGNEGAVRLSEDKSFLEAMNQEVAQTLFYGNPATEPREFLGLAQRYGAISGAGNAQNIITGGSTSNSVSTSIWLVGWGPETVFGIFPKGSMAGLQHKDLGEQTVYDASNDPYQAYRTYWKWQAGLVVRDWRYVVRIPNILVTDLTSVANTQATTASTLILKLMARALDRLPTMNGVRPVFYMNRTVHSAMRVMAMEKTVNVLSIIQGLNQFGDSQSWTQFDGVPLRKADQLLNTETAFT